MVYLPLNAIRVFEAVARRLSFSAAGEELHVTHAAVSHQIRRLEEWLGVALFERGGRQVRLTEAGRTLLTPTAYALRDLEEACRRVRQSARTDMLSVGCIPSIASRWLVPRLSAFTHAYPEIGIKVVYAKAEDRLGDGESDVLITLGADPAADVSNRKLFSRASHPVCSPHYLARHGQLTEPREIAAADLLHDENRDGWRNWAMKARVRGADVSRGPVFADFNILATAVIAGHGVALCPVDVFREELSRGDLVRLSEIAIDEDKNYFLTMRRPGSTSALAFAAWFIAEVSAP